MTTNQKPDDRPASTVSTPLGAMPAEPPPPITGPGNAMVIMAHPDDAEFLCGGTVARWAAEGWDVRYVVVTNGDKGTRDATMHPEKLAAIREQEQRDACRILGVRECIFLGYPDGYTTEDHELRDQIVRLLRRFRPDVVITWDGFRGTFNHRDHRVVGTVVADAIYPLVRDRLFYPHHEEDGLAPHEVDEVLLAGATTPDYNVDITAHWETKISAILAHTSQMGGRTREDFLKMRQEQIERDGPDAPIEERFRRWTIGRPMRPAADKPAQEKSASAPADQR